MTEDEMYIEADYIAVAGMGRKNAEGDPLAYWELVEMIVNFGRRARGQKGLFDKIKPEKCKRMK